nr:hypothetical protein [Candidatus Liberibacter solanacearum]
MAIGIEDISFYTTNQYLDLSVIADKHCVDIGKFYHGIGQERMSVLHPDEDIVTMLLLLPFLSLKIKIKT